MEKVNYPHILRLEVELGIIDPLLYAKLYSRFHKIVGRYPTDREIYDIIQEATYGVTSE